jgi:hypothetical protein
MKVLAWFVDPNDIQNTNIVNYPYPIDIKKCENLIIATRMVSEKEDATLTVVRSMFSLIYIEVELMNK